MKKATFALLSLAFVLCSPLLQADTIWIDVRSEAEHAADSIEGDLLMPLDQLNAEKLAAEFGLDAEIVLYCRSGNRAGQAQELLQAAGFTHVSNGGSIGDVRELRASTALRTGGAPAAATGAAGAANR